MKNIKTIGSLVGFTLVLFAIMSKVLLAAESTGVSGANPPMPERAVVGNTQPQPGVGIQNQTMAASMVPSSPISKVSASILSREEAAARKGMVEVTVQVPRGNGLTKKVWVFSQEVSAELAKTEQGKVWLQLQNFMSTQQKLNIARRVMAAIEMKRMAEEMRAKMAARAAAVRVKADEMIRAAKGKKEPK